jgi:DNA gyrase subunit B
MIGNGGREKGNTEVKAIVSAVGAGIGSDFQVDQMRNGGVAILVDADVDGAHIRTLLHTLFWRHMKPMVLAGKLWIAMAPLYQLKKKGKPTVYAYSEQERDKTLEQWGKEGVAIQRYKGLGEMNPGQLRETIFAVSEQTGVLNEHMVQVVVDDPRTSRTMEVLMGSEVAPRKQWLLQEWTGEEESEWGE